jgi:hypothetical protein
MGGCLVAALKKKINPMRVLIEKNEGIRWLEKVRQSMELLGGGQLQLERSDARNDTWRRKAWLGYYYTRLSRLRPSGRSQGYLCSVARSTF